MSSSRREFLKVSAMLASSSVLPMQALAKNPEESKLVGIAQSTIDSKASPAIQISVVKSGIQKENIALGHCNLESLSLASPRTIFRIGSLTKQITGALILKLSSEGKIALDEPASKYLPFLEKYARFTVRELVHHTAGVHDDQEALPLTGDVTQHRLAQAISDQKIFFDFQPGTAWLYSNANYILLGAIIEAVTSLTLKRATEDYITSKLSLSRTSYDDPSQVIIGRAAGYVLAESKSPTFFNAPWIDVPQAGAAGAMRSTASELANLHQALLFGNLLSHTERAQFLAPGRLRDGRLSSANRFSEKDRVMGDMQYGFGVNLDTSTRDKSLIVHHNGFISGFSSYLATHIPSQLTVACLCNIDANPTLPFREIRRLVFKDYLNAPKV